jgi:tetrapyrrole methylase family protein/MazG family protein
MQSFQKLLTIAKRLRSPTGCPWDREQTVKSLAPKIQEETEEVLAAIRKKDWPNLEEELGDLLFNIILTTQIASEAKLFRMDGVLKKVEQKIIARHSWVFGQDRHKVKTAADAKRLWQENKAKLKKQKK